jgi:hypothetical protein
MAEVNASVTDTPVTPPDDIRSAVEAAFNEHEAPELPLSDKTPKPEKANGAAKADAADDALKPKATDAGERARGADGKFVKAEGAEDAAAAEPDAEKTEPPKAETEVKAEGGEKPATEIKDAVEPPVSLAAADKEKFATLPVEAQRMVAEVVKRQDAAFTKKTQAIAALKNEYEPVDKLFEPHRETMRAKGFSPRAIIEAWANVEQRLVAGDGVNIIKGLVEGYKIDPRQLANALGLQPQARQTPPQQQLDDLGNPLPPVQEQQPAQLPPELIAELRSLRERQDRMDNERALQARLTAQSAETKVMTEIEQFKSVTDGKGNLLHPHFEDVEDQMTALANAAIARKQTVPPLKDLYETAVWANPSTRATLIAADRQADERRKGDEARAKAAAAKKASSSVTGAPGSGQSAPVKSAERSLHDELMAAVEDNAA